MKYSGYRYCKDGQCFLVVVGHVFHGKYFFVWEKVLQEVIYSFHMPLFMFISGYLFFTTQIKRNKPYCRVVKNKAVRLLIPYFCLSLFTLVLKVVFSGYMKRSSEFSFQQLLDAFVWLTNNPLGEMWFINSLFGLFLLYPVYCWADAKNLRGGLLIVLFLILHFVSPPFDNFILNYEKIFSMGIYFVTGISFAKYSLEDRIFTRALSLLYIIVFGLCFVLRDVSFFMPLLCSLAGVLFSFSMAKIVGSFLSSLFSSFRNYTYQIFLLGIFPQIFVRIIMEKLN